MLINVQKTLKRTNEMLRIVFTLDLSGRTAITILDHVLNVQPELNKQHEICDCPGFISCAIVYII